MNSAGVRAEDLCADLLRASGLRVIERNWRCRHGEIDLIAEERGVLVFAEVRMRSGVNFGDCRHGEIDLIAEERGVLVFAEVRMRSGVNFGGAAESVTGAKRARLIAAARLYLMRKPESACRFDVFLVGREPSRVEWIRNAFGE